MFASAVVEVLFSVLIAPVMMLFHAYFVLTILGGHAVSWNPQTRDGRSLELRETARYLLVPTLIGVLWGTVTFFVAPQFFWWLTPVLIGLGIAIPLVRWSSHVHVGHVLRRLGVFLIPEELHPPVELRMVQEASEVAAEERPSVCSAPPLLTPPEAHGVMRPQEIETVWPWSRKGSWGAYAPQSER